MPGGVEVEPGATRDLLGGERTVGEDGQDGSIGAIGGVMKQEQNTSRYGLPGVSGLPGVGALFGAPVG